ncbi:MAG TPA: VWA domain-containing protein [Terriglobales bacterium]|nr:VWA domain-containing protein [Terriglobales bacterium]
MTLRRVLTAAWMAFGLLASLGVPGLAQQQQGLKPGQTPTIVKNVNSVPLPFVALDKHNHFVPGLTAAQIEVLDNNQPQKIQNFDSQGNLPLRIVLLLDVSNSIRTRWDFEKRAALDFLQSVLVEGRDQAMVVGFDTSTHIAQPFTDKFEALSRGINTLNPSGGTALYDAVYQISHDELGGGATNGGEVRNVIVLISDGADDQSRYSREEALAMAQDAGAVIYTIGTEPTGADPESDKVLERFAVQTGGSSYYPIEARDLGSAFQSITTELRHQYVVSYSPDNFLGNGEYHSVEIKVSVKGVTARTRKGYFARGSAGH